MKRLLLLIITCFINIPFFIIGASENDIQAGEGYLYLTLKSGEIARYATSDSPKILIEGKNVTVGNDVYQISDINKYAFIDSSPSKINTIDSESFFTFTNGQILIPSSTEVTSIHLIDLAGIEYPIKPTENTKTDCLSISIQDLTPNIYILSVSGHSIKFVKK